MWKDTFSSLGTWGPRMQPSTASVFKRRSAWMTRAMSLVALILAMLPTLFFVKGSMDIKLDTVVVHDGFDGMASFQA